MARSPSRYLVISNAVKNLSLRYLEECAEQQPCTLHIPMVEYKCNIKQQSNPWPPSSI